MKLFVEDMLETVKFVPVSLFIALVFALIYIVICIMRKKELKPARTALIILDVVYFATVLQIALLSRVEGSVTEIDFTLLGRYTDDLRGRMYIYENVLMTIPMGILLPLTFKKRFKFLDTLLCTFMLSILIEMIQLAFRCGFCQLSDVIMNVLGGFIGYLIYKVFKLLGGKR
ncbi:MAG: VanZ family protein [Lachnospiraceae bacterium]|nr:VanZ family protein [Lachnospiraceae bacterium]